MGLSTLRAYALTLPLGKRSRVSSGLADVLSARMMNLGPAVCGTQKRPGGVEAGGGSNRVNAARSGLRGGGGPRDARPCPRDHCTCAAPSHGAAERGLPVSAAAAAWDRG